MKKPTMRDIARAAGTSAVTVSKALGGQPGMSEETRNRIVQIAEELGYEYPVGKRTEPVKRHLDIGILIPDRYFDTNSYYSEMYRQLVRKLTERGNFGVLEILTRENEQQLVVPNLMQSGRVDGMIILGEPDKTYYRMLSRQETPLVFLDFYDEQANADAVVGDNTYGTYRLTSHLIRLGHSRIGFVGNQCATESIMDRYLGFYRAMLVHGLPVKPEWILPDRKEDSGLYPPELPEDMPDALVCNCDLTARMMITLLRGKGFRVPEDVTVTGFDNFPPGGEDDFPLSTFRIDMESMVDMAVKMIMERCAGSDKPFSRMVIGGQPVYRD